MENLDTSEAQTSQSTDPKPEDNEKPKDNDFDVAVEALLHLNQGKRHLLVEDYPSAVTSLQDSCQLFDQRFGIGAEECGEAYLYYGTALLELARLEDGLFDGVIHTKLAELSGDEATEDEEEDEEEEESQDETENKDKTEEKKTDTEEDIEDSDEEKKKQTNGSEKDKEPEPEPCPQSSSATTETSSMECQPSTSKGEEANDDTGDDDASNIEVAWEVLCLAKNVFSRHLDANDNKLKLAETLQKLGEISIEWENNVNAIDLLTRCLNHRKEILPEDDRLIAETYYHLGIAFSFNNNTEDANNCFHSAIQVIESRISNQKQKLSTVNPEDIETNESIKREISRLESLLPEMKVKIEDSKEQLQNVKDAIEREVNEQKEEEAITPKKNEIKDKPITDISHLIKRKRQNSGPENSPKKLCSNGVNAVDNIKSDESLATN